MMRKIIGMLFVLFASTRPVQEAPKLSSFEQFEKTVIGLEGEKGRQWLADLPRLTQELSCKWGLSDLKPVKELSCNYVLKGFRGTQPIILKICPDKNDFQEEVQGLQLLASSSLVRIFECDVESHAFLMERAVPGVSLRSCYKEKEEEGLQFVCNVIQHLPHLFECKTTQFQLRSKMTRVLYEKSVAPEQYLVKARALEKLLIETAAKPLTLCHGDLHHGNIVQQDTGWLAIDPFPLFAEPAYDVAVFVWNPCGSLFQMPDVELHTLLKKRIAVFAQRLHLDPERIQRWCFVQVTASWVWASRSNRNGSISERMVKFLDPLTPVNLEISSPLCGP